MRITFITAAALLIGAPVSSQSLDVPFAVPTGELQGFVGGCGIHYVAGLNPAGDGFLAVRTGPGSNFKQIDQVHNGDVVYTCVSSGAWRGVVYTGSSQHNSHRDQHDRLRGWVHSNWLVNGAG